MQTNTVKEYLEHKRVNKRIEQQPKKRIQDAVSQGIIRAAMKLATLGRFKLPEKLVKVDDLGN